MPIGPTPTPVLAFRQVTFGYGGARVLDGVDLDVRAGELLAILGANGSGKTTLMRLGLGLERAQAGQVLLFGDPVGKFRRWERVGYVPQRSVADAPIPISVEEVVRTGLAGHLGLLGRPSMAQRQGIREVTEELGVHDLRRHPIGRLSGGQQQRVLIARALVTRPRLLILDEPTTGVDRAARHVLRGALARLVGEGVAVIYITHDPEGFAGLAGRVVELREGRAVPCDDPTAHRHVHTDPDEGVA